jgi:hypothetical protein
MHLRCIRAAAPAVPPYLIFGTPPARVGFPTLFPGGGLHAGLRFGKTNARHGPTASADPGEPSGLLFVITIYYNGYYRKTPSARPKS